MKKHGHLISASGVKKDKLDYYTVYMPKKWFSRKAYSFSTNQIYLILFYIRAGNRCTKMFF